MFLTPSWKSCRNFQKISAFVINCFDSQRLSVFLDIWEFLDFLLVALLRELWKLLVFSVAVESLRIFSSLWNLSDSYILSIRIFNFSFVLLVTSLKISKIFASFSFYFLISNSFKILTVNISDNSQLFELYWEFLKFAILLI